MADHLEDGGLMDLDVAVDRLRTAARRGETVMIHGDYDVDGMASTAILVRTLESLGVRAVPFIPRRLLDGYDLTSAGVNAATAASATLVVTCDCGTSAIAPVAGIPPKSVNGGRKVRHLQYTRGGCSQIWKNGPRYAAG